MRTRLAWIALTMLVALVASLPFWVQLPSPDGTIEIDTAHFTSVSGETADIALPHQWPDRPAPEGGMAEYRFGFELEALPSQRLFLFIPMLSQRAVVSLGGREIYDTASRSLLFGVASGVPALVPLPLDRLQPGHNTIELQLDGGRVLRGYLSSMYVGSEAQLSPHHRLRTFLFEHLRLMIFSAQLLLMIGVGIAWLYRPNEPLFGWLSLLLVISFFYHAGGLVNFAPQLHDTALYAYMLTSTSAPILPIIALLISHRPVPRVLRWAVVAVPAVCLLLALPGLVPVQAVILLFCVPLMLTGLLAAVFISARGALYDRVNEAWLLLVPLALLTWTGFHDFLVVLGAIEWSVRLSGYYRPLMLLAISAIFMRRLGISLQRLDNANAHLSERLCEQEATLARLYAEEREEAAQRVREQERRRLTEDLHDGLSGHLASIIALAERDATPSIEQAAREALDDLRLVIYSLDIGDRELALALSSFRERLMRQLKRLGITLDWSIAELPEVSGVTPAQALNVLRILQEAVTNALKHGPASRISLRGSANSDGKAVITVENDGAPCIGRSGGSGLDNMRRRAGQLGGKIYIEALANGTRIILVLPLQLPAGELDVA